MKIFGFTIVKTEQLEVIIRRRIWEALKAEEKARDERERQYIDIIRSINRIRIKSGLEPIPSYYPPK